jgi:hypothetical protein
MRLPRASTGFDSAMSSLALSSVAAGMVGLRGGGRAAGRDHPPGPAAPSRAPGALAALATEVRSTSGARAATAARLRLHERKAAERVQLDIVFVIDRSHEHGEGESWEETSSALRRSPTIRSRQDRRRTGLLSERYNAVRKQLRHRGPLQGPRRAHRAAAGQHLRVDELDARRRDGDEHAHLRRALKGTLMAATALPGRAPHAQGHRRVEPATAASTPADRRRSMTSPIGRGARSNYNGVRTYVIGVQSASNYPPRTSTRSPRRAARGYRPTTSRRTSTIFPRRWRRSERRRSGCDFDIPPVPPNGEELDSGKVNFTYTPQGMGDAQDPCSAPTTSPTAAVSPAGTTTTTSARPRSSSAPRRAAHVQNDTEGGGLRALRLQVPGQLRRVLLVVAPLEGARDAFVS